MEHDDALANKCAEKYPGYAFGALEPQLKETFTKRFGARFSKVGTKGNHPPREHDIPCSKRIRQLDNLPLHGLAVVDDDIVHPGIVTIMLCFCK